MLFLVPVIWKGLRFTSASSVSLHPSVFLYLSSCHTSCLCPPPLLRPRFLHHGNPTLSCNNTLVILPSLLQMFSWSCRRGHAYTLRHTRQHKHTPTAPMISVGHTGRGIYRWLLSVFSWTKAPDILLPSSLEGGRFVKVEGYLLFYGKKSNKNVFIFARVLHIAAEPRHVRRVVGSWPERFSLTLSCFRMWPQHIRRRATDNYCCIQKADLTASSIHSISCLLTLCTLHCLTVSFEKKSVKFLHYFN